VRSLKVTSLVCLGHFFSHFYYLLPLTLLPTLKTELGESYTALGIALAGYGLTTTIAQVPVGFLVDRFGAPLILVTGLALSSLSMIALGSVMTGYAQLVVIILVTGLGDSVFHPANYSILARSVEPAYAGRVFSAHNFAGQFGFAVSPFLTGFAAAHFGWRPAVVAFGVAGLVTAAVLLSQRKFLGTALKTPAMEAQSSTDTRTGWQLLLSRPILLCLAVFIGIGFINSGARDFGVTALQLMYSASTAKIGSIISLYLLASLFGIMLGGWLADRTAQYRSVAAVSLSVIAIALPAIALVKPPLAELCATFCVLGLFSGTIQASRDMLVRSITPPREAGKTFGFVSLGISIASLIAPFVYGLILDHAAPTTIFYVTGLFGAVTVAMVLAGDPGLKRAASAA
jgi:MFS family permease